MGFIDGVMDFFGGSGNRRTASEEVYKIGLDELMDSLGIEDKPIFVAYDYKEKELTVKVKT